MASSLHPANFPLSNLFPELRISGSNGSSSAADCNRNPEKVLAKLMKRGRSTSLENWKREKFKYPQNMMRNLGREGCETEYTIVPGDTFVDAYLENECSLASRARIVYQF